MPPRDKGFGTSFCRMTSTHDHASESVRLQSAVNGLGYEMLFWMSPFFLGASEGIE